MSRTLTFQSPFIPYCMGHDLRRFTADELHVTRVCSYYVLIFMLDNKLHFNEDGEPITVSPGQWYIQAPNLTQEGIIQSPNATYYYIHFTPINVAEDAFGMTQDVVLPIRGMYYKPSFLPLLEEMDHLSTLPMDRYKKQLIFQQIMLQLLESCSPTKSPSSQLADAIIHYIDTHYSTITTCQAMEEQFHYSSTHLESSLRQNYGITPWQYVIKVRMDHATHMLTHTNDTVQAIAQQVGYNDLSVFFKAFKKHLGMTPKAWRYSSRRID